MKVAVTFSQMRNKLFGIGFAALCAVVVGLPMGAQAATFEYDLFNRPEGGSFFPPQYGMILHGLLDPNETFTFSFEDSAGNSTMSLVYDDVANSVHIFGTVFGGIDSGDTYDPAASGVWNVDFTYQTNVTESNGDGSDILVTDQSANNSGYISPTFDILGVAAGEQIALTDKKNDARGFSFLFNNTDAQDIIDVIPAGDFIGWGWLTYNTFTNEGAHVSPSDFIFTARPATTEVPEPGTVLLLGAGLVGIARRRREKKSA